MAVQVVAELWRELLGRRDCEALLREIFAAFEKPSLPADVDGYQPARRLLVRLRIIFDLQRVQLQNCSAPPWNEKLDAYLISPELHFDFIQRIVQIGFDVAFKPGFVSEYTLHRRLVSQTLVSAIRAYLLRQGVLTNAQIEDLRRQLRELVEKWDYQVSQCSLTDGERFVLQTILPETLRSINSAQHGGPLRNLACGLFKLPELSTGLYPFTITYARNHNDKPENALRAISAELDRSYWLQAYWTLYDVTWAVRAAVVKGLVDGAEPSLESQATMTRVLSAIFDEIQGGSTRRLAATSTLLDPVSSAYGTSKTSLYHLMLDQTTEVSPRQVDAELRAFKEFLQPRHAPPASAPKIDDDLAATRLRVLKSIQDWCPPAQAKPFPDDIDQKRKSVESLGPLFVPVYAVNCNKMHPLSKFVLESTLRSTDRTRFQMHGLSPEPFEIIGDVNCPKCDSPSPMSMARCIQPFTEIADVLQLLPATPLPAMPLPAMPLPIPPQDAEPRKTTPVFPSPFIEHSNPAPEAVVRSNTLPRQTPRVLIPGVQGTTPPLSPEVVSVPAVVPPRPIGVTGSQRRSVAFTAIPEESQAPEVVPRPGRYHSNGSSNSSQPRSPRSDASDGSHSRSLSQATDTDDSSSKKGRFSGFFPTKGLWGGGAQREQKQALPDSLAYCFSSTGKTLLLWLKKDCGHIFKIDTPFTHGTRLSLLNGRETHVAGGNVKYVAAGEKHIAVLADYSREGQKLYLFDSNSIRHEAPSATLLSKSGVLCTGLALSPDGTLIALGWGPTIQIYRFADGALTLLTALPIHESHSGTVVRYQVLNFSSDSRRLLVATQEIHDTHKHAVYLRIWGCEDSEIRRRTAPNAFSVTVGYGDDTGVTNVFYDANSAKALLTANISKPYYAFHSLNGQRAVLEGLSAKNVDVAAQGPSGSFYALKNGRANKIYRLDGRSGECVLAVDLSSEMKGSKEGVCLGMPEDDLLLVVWRRGAKLMLKKVGLTGPKPKIDTVDLRVVYDACLATTSLSGEVERD
ncbi:hypothetical protein EJ06DRAFT_331588 [Trichodelitschia bisporula]|uniref:Uncharacterized protein n=1 Tax=Trichodelitschia bisporula TaxID=703511 RepID=A0A6G1I2I2_9PEZI|nr:hypothetical protein EJ06DRAFT_331588 [Trichodelitschia bisporula]